MKGWVAAREVVQCEWQLVRAYPRLAAALAGLLFVPALYAWICLYAMWDPASHTRSLPAGLVSVDAGARYRDRELNLGTEVLQAIERQGQFAYRRYQDPAEARRDVRQGRLAFVLEVPADFSRRALPGEQPGAAKLTIYTSEGNHYASAGFARQFAPEVAQRVNTMLSEARWDLVLSSADGSQRNLETLRDALADLHRGAGELHVGLVRAQQGGAQLATGSTAAGDAAARLRQGATQIADSTQQLQSGLRQLSGPARAMAGGPPPEAELTTLRQGMRAQLDGQRDLLRGLDGLAAGSRALEGGLGQLKLAADDVPLFGGRLTEGIVPVSEGAQQLSSGLERAREGQARLLQGAQRLDEGLGLVADAAQRTGQASASLQARLPDEGRVEVLADGARELARGQDALAVNLRQLGAGSQTLQGGLLKLTDGAGRLDTGLELLRGTLPESVDRPDGSAQGLALSVEPVVEVVAPVPNQGTALAPNFVPLALWVGAVMAAFLFHLRRVPEALSGHPRAALAAGKLALPAAVVVVQASVMLAMLHFVLHVRAAHPGLFALALLTTSLAFLALVWALVRLLGAVGQVAALLLIVVQVSAAGALLPIELSDEAFQALHPYLPLTWVVQALRVSLFGAFDGAFWPPFQAIVGVALAGLAIGTLAGRWRALPPEQWKPPLDLE